MANYVNYQNTDQPVWNKPQSRLGIVHRSVEESRAEKTGYCSDSWIREMDLAADTTDSPSPAHSTDSIYDLASDPASVDSEDGYEVPVSTIDRLNRRNKETGRTEHGGGQWEKKDMDFYASMDPAPPVPANEHGTRSGKKAKYKPVPAKRKNKSGLQDSTYCLAKSDSSLDSIDLSTSPSQQPKKTLSRQKVIVPVKGGSGQALSTGREPRSRSWDRRPEKRGLEPEPQRVPGEQKQEGEGTSDVKGGGHFRQARSNSVVSDRFEDALEYLPGDWAPAKPKGEKGGKIRHLGGSGRSRVTDPVTGGNYEEAWDLNPRLEAKLSSLKLMQSRPDVVAQSTNEGNYLEPWDSSRKQQELEEKLHKASKSRGREKNGQSSLHGHSSGEKCKEVSDGRSFTSQTFQSSQDAASSGSLDTSSCSLRSVCASLRGPINSTDCLENQLWYHGNVSRIDAERMLLVCKEGSYLVRDSSDRCHYTLSIKCSSQMIHIQIEQSVVQDGSMRYILGHHSRAFPTIPTMIHHYSQEPVPIKGAQHIKLLYPVPRS